MAHKVKCSICGSLEEPRWMFSGLCIDCFVKDENWVENSPDLDDTGRARDECALCGVLLDGASELCRRCDPTTKWH